MTGQIFFCTRGQLSTFFSKRLTHSRSITPHIWSEQSLTFTLINILLVFLANFSLKINYLSEFLFCIRTCQIYRNKGQFLIDTPFRQTEAGKFLLFSTDYKPDRKQPEIFSLELKSEI